MYAVRIILLNRTARDLFILEEKLKKEIQSILLERQETQMISNLLHVDEVVL
jgi:K+/H+ antiporter YhaU regulatory subunit KhtT